MTPYQIRMAALELFRENMPISHPYKIEKQHFDSLFIYGPDAALDWLEGIPTNEKYQIAVVNFREHAAVLHIYNRYQPALGVRRDTAKFEYGDPAFPDNVIEWTQRIIDHHDLLREVEKDEYIQFVNEKRRQGCVIITYDDVPDGRCPKYDRRTYDS